MRKMIAMWMITMLVPLALLTFGLLLFGAPLSAQQTVVVPDVNVDVQNVIDSIGVVVTVEIPPPDSAAVARDEAAQRAMETIAEYLENCGCVNTGPTNINVVANAGLTIAALLIAWQLKGIKDTAAHEHEDEQRDDDYRGSEP